MARAVLVRREVNIDNGHDWYVVSSDAEAVAVTLAMHSRGSFVVLASFPPNDANALADALREVAANVRLRP